MFRLQKSHVRNGDMGIRTEAQLTSAQPAAASSTVGAMAAPRCSIHSAAPPPHPHGSASTAPSGRSQPATN
eukprot:2159943-Pyramimonas_sp.AAC.1